jgi:hypothetical protein
MIVSYKDRAGKCYNKTRTLMRFSKKDIFVYILCHRNALAYYNAIVVVVKAESDP